MSYQSLYDAEMILRSQWRGGFVFLISFFLYEATYDPTGGRWADSLGHFALIFWISLWDAVPILYTPLSRAVNILGYAIATYSSSLDIHHALSQGLVVLADSY